MPLLTRALCLVLAALVGLAGAPLDLCTCGVDGHGALCAASDDAHDAGPAPGAPALPAPGAPALPAPGALTGADDHGCCAGGPTAPATVAPATVETTVRAAECACPVLVVEAPPAEPGLAVAPAAPAPLHVDLGPVPGALTVAAPAASDAAHARAPPRGSSLRRHLALHVLRL